MLIVIPGRRHGSQARASYCRVKKREQKKKAGTSHLLSPTMSGNEIGGEPAITELRKLGIVLLFLHRNSVLIVFSSSVESFLNFISCNILMPNPPFLRYNRTIAHRF